MSQGHDRDAHAPPTPPATRAPRRRRTIALTIALLVIVGAAIAATVPFWPRRAAPDAPRRSRNLPPDPRLLYQGPLGNIHPDIAYVGDNRCTPCHADIAASYRRHPMGRSLQPVESVRDHDVYDAARNNPFEALGVRFRIERRAEEVRHQVIYADVPGQPPIQSDFSVDFVIGSGSHGRSYISNRDGYLFQTPISWFSQKQFWNLSPGFSGEQLTGRPVAAECLFCHANRANPHEGALNRFDAPVFTGHAIGCERCHGPGERHIETVKKLDIVNPGRLTPALREAVCEQCHLEGEERILRRGRGLYDFRPGLPLADFWTVFVSAAEAGGERRAVSHVEQMHESRCYQASRKDDVPLGCVSCHDPHVFVEPAERVPYYRQRCLKCHDSRPCSLPGSARRKQQADGSCIACHMPRFRAVDIAHTAASDHRVVRRPSPEPKDGLPRPAVPPRLVPFHTDRPSSDGPELARDLGVALVKGMWADGSRTNAPRVDAVALLESAVQNDPEDVAAWQGKGEALMQRGRRSEALAAFQRALRTSPEEEGCLSGAAALTQDMGQREESLGYWHRVVAVNPWMPVYRRNFAHLLEHAGRWDEVRVQCRTWMSLEPNSVEARQLWITCLLREGAKEDARAELARIEALKPANLLELREWFEKQKR